MRLQGGEEKERKMRGKREGKGECKKRREIEILREREENGESEEVDDAMNGISVSKSIWL